MTQPLSRLRSAFRPDRPAFIPFIMAGDPDLATTATLVHALASAGADAIELGAPFSDPIADGPVNQRAADRALRSGTTFSAVADLALRLRSELSIPLVLFTYLNPLLAYGRAPTGFDAALVLDPAEDDDVAPLAGMDRVWLAAPSTSERRLRAIGDRPGSFLYYVSRYGVTGAAGAAPSATLGADVARVRALARRPVAVGFGITTPAQAAEVARVADGVIVGSAIVERIERAGRDAAPEVRRFATELARAIHGDS